MINEVETVEESRSLVGETRTEHEATVVDRREVTDESRTAVSESSSYGSELKAKSGTKSSSSSSKSGSKSGSKSSSSKSNSKSSSKKGSSKKSDKDNLTKIEGIGPKIAGILNSNGVHTFRKLSETKAELIREWLTTAGPRFRMHNPGSWPKQSLLAADGEWDALKKLQDELDGGR